MDSNLLTIGTLVDLGYRGFNEKYHAGSALTRILQDALNRYFIRHGFSCAPGWEDALSSSYAQEEETGPTSLDDQFVSSLESNKETAEANAQASNLISADNSADPQALSEEGSNEADVLRVP